MKRSREPGLSASEFHWLAGALIFSACEAAGAHPSHAAHVALPWTWEPWVIACLGATTGLYIGGITRMWSSAGVGRGISRPRAAAFAGGCVIVAIALLSPLDVLGSYLFSAHMLQHELLMIVAAPLLVISKPLAVWSWIVPSNILRTVAGADANRVISWTWKAVTCAPSAWIVHASSIWAWHAPRLFDAALDDAAVHTLQHATFFLSALLFWWAVLGTARPLGRGAALVYLFTTMVHTTVLGALLTLAPSPWYAGYGARTGLFGFTPLEDQQLGGLVMWIPGGISYLAASLAIAWQSLKGRDDCWQFQASR